MTYFDEKVIKANPEKRDRFIIKLMNEGYVSGFVRADDINEYYGSPIIWSGSHPEVTIKGMEFIHENKSMKSAIEEIKAVAIESANSVVTAIITKLL